MNIIHIDSCILDAVLDRTEKYTSEGGTQFIGMSYEEGIEELILWLNGDITDEQFPYSGKYQG